MAPLATYEDLATRIDHTLTAPELDNAQIVQGLEIAKRYGTGSAVVRPCDIDLAVRTLERSGVRPASVACFPHGTQNTAVKLYEIRDLLRRGAKEIEMVLGLPKLLSREFQHVQTELLQAAESCHKEGAKLTVILDTARLTEELKIIAARCLERAEVDFVTAAGDFALLRRYLPDEAGIKAEGADTLDAVLALHEAGAARVGTTASSAILDEWKARLAAAAAATTPAAP